MVCSALSLVDNRLYTPETSSPPSIPLTNALTNDPPHPGTPPTFISPMYTNLWANTPRDCMTFSDQEFPSGTTNFPFRTQILDYLRRYGKDIKHLVKFNKEVIRVENHGKWHLTIRSLEEPTQPMHIEEFDAVAVASGFTLHGLAYIRAFRRPVHPFDSRYREVSFRPDHTCEIFPPSFDVQR